MSVGETNTKPRPLYSDLPMTHRCGHPTTTGPGTCDRTIPDEADVCFLHDESGTPLGHGALEGNANAVGNSGGSAPPMNSNALVHGGFRDLTNTPKPIRGFRGDESARRQTSHSATPMSANSVVQTGLKTQFGGASVGR